LDIVQQALMAAGQVESASAAWGENAIPANATAIAVQLNSRLDDNPTVQSVNTGVKLHQ
jgi:hypothetical protein